MHHPPRGKDCRFSFEGSLYSAPAECAGQRIALRIFPGQVCLYPLKPIPRALGAHSRVRQRGSLVEEPAHDAALHRARGATPPLPPAARAVAPLVPQLTPLAPFDVPVMRRPLAVYALLGAGQEVRHE